MEGRRGRMEHRAYRPVLSTGQARMPTLPKACRYLNAGKGQAGARKSKGEVQGGWNPFLPPKPISQPQVVM